MNLADILAGIAYDEFLTGQLLVSEEGIRFEILGIGVRVIDKDLVREYEPRLLFSDEAVVGEELVDDS